MNIEAIKQYARNKGDHKLLALIGEQEPEKAKEERWKPSEGEVCYGISVGGSSDMFCWREPYFNNLQWKVGNCYRTDAQAQERAKLVKAAYKGQVIIVPEADKYSYHNGAMGITDKPEEDVNLECYSSAYNKWIPATSPCWNAGCTYRWLKQEVQG